MFKKMEVFLYGLRYQKLIISNLFVILMKKLEVKFYKNNIEILKIMDVYSNIELQ